MRRYRLPCMPMAALVLVTLLSSSPEGHAAPAAAGGAASPSAPAGAGGNAGAAAPAATAAAKLAGPPKPWKDMTAKERGKYMKTVVTPKMKPVFQAFDGKTFKRFTCETCHGKSPEERKFKMPSPDIHALPGTPEAFKAKLAAEPTWPKWTKFMSEEVEPQMAALLGLPVFDPKKPEAGGFSCAGCHKIDKP